MKTLEQRIQERAYEIWEKRSKAGLPDANNSEQNYYLAMQEVAAEETLAKAKAPVVAHKPEVKVAAEVKHEVKKPEPAHTHAPVKAVAPVAAPVKKAAAAPVKKSSKR
ncbi:MAG: DUF2934 domain-containing protein [Chitinispirillia bacterium]|nr:DUF2934 domain-containing protein [Chitinispirillia bacterium]MCL2241989.1 DUF2934 domain-containing protein [Chitinispirillia bacterium]